MTGGEEEANDGGGALGSVGDGGGVTAALDGGLALAVVAVPYIKLVLGLLGARLAKISRV
jgi:hypothetical protein